ncbi:MAG: cyclase [Anaerolineaceae bacterium]|nr:cyclase [Anaerolineaceae bacterium]|tara:strand:- start:12207 stop:12845 length:639 start_codon:yes stop_codon:yes gene_type:complete
MAIIDISLGIKPGFPVWPGHPVIRFTSIQQIGKDSKANVTQIELGAHSGTHLDAPLHFLKDGFDVTAIDLEILVGSALLIDVANAEVIDADLLDTLSIPKGTERLLIKTTNSQLWSENEIVFHKDFVAIEDSGARWIVEHGIRLVGVDYLSVAPYGNTGPTHYTLLRAGIVPVEGLNFDGVQEGRYHLICLPIKLEGCEGAPARAVLIDVDK